jgi:hypothetical protein
MRYAIQKLNCKKRCRINARFIDPGGQSAHGNLSRPTSCYSHACFEDSTGLRIDVHRVDKLARLWRANCLEGKNSLERNQRVGI